MKRWFLRRHSGLKNGIHYLKCGKGNEIIRCSWQNIVIVVSIILVVLMVGRIILDYKAENNKNIEETVNCITYTSDNVKRAYLTFDDGPSSYTNEILDILKENNVKATFFVIGRGENYYDEYRRIVDEGHTLGMHSYTHKYDEIYASLDNFSRDIEELHNLLYDVTGVDCVYYRFPGGSSNTVSSVPMSQLVDYINNQGYIYFDWNALNGDSLSSDLTAEQLVENVFKDALKYDDTIILMHDIESSYATVESLQLLIDKLRDAGYELLPIDENTPRIIHKAVN